MERKVLVLRKNEEDGTWCELNVRLTFDDEGKPDRLAISGATGEILSREMAEEQAKEYWVSFFSESPEELGSMMARFPLEVAKYITETGDAEEGAAQFVVDTDGALHGMDVHLEDGENVLITGSCGQIREELTEWFHDLLTREDGGSWLDWHLNDMKAGCEHQEKLGWGRGRNVALSRADCTPAQVKSLDDLLAAGVKRARDKRIEKELDTLAHGLLNRPMGRKAYNILKAAGLDATIFEVETIRKVHPLTLANLTRCIQPDSLRSHKGVLRKLLSYLMKLAELEHPDQTFSSEIFKDSLGAPCPECGYRYGTGWLKRELPSDVVAWFDSLKEAE